MAIRTKTVIFTILLVLGLLLRCYYTDWDKKLTGDEVGYNKMVLQLLHEGVYGYAPYAYSEKSNAFTTPGYPLFWLAVMPYLDMREIVPSRTNSGAANIDSAYMCSYHV